MKILDNKGRIFGKFSIVDLFVALLVIACVGAVGLKLKTAQSVSGGDRTITYQILVENIRDVSVNAVKSKTEKVIDTENKKELGSITDVETRPARVLVQTNDGKFQIQEYTNRYDATVTLKASGTETDDGYFTASGRQISAGETMGVNNGAVEFFGEVISVTVE